MLVLSRKPGEKICIGDSIVIKVVRIGPNTVRIGIDAPGDIAIHRWEVREAITAELQALCEAEQTVEQ